MFKSILEFLILGFAAVAATGLTTALTDVDADQKVV